MADHPNEIETGEMIRALEQLFRDTQDVLDGESPRQFPQTAECVAISAGRPGYRPATIPL